LSFFNNKNIVTPAVVWNRAQ